MTTRIVMARTRRMSIQSIPAPIQSEVTSKRHQKLKEQKEENEQSKEEKRLKFRKALDELREGRTVAVPRPMD